MKNYKVYLSIIFIVILILLPWQYMVHIESEKSTLEQISYNIESKLMKQKVSNMIKSKQNATLAIALSLAADINLDKKINTQKDTKEYFEKLIKTFRKETAYKNIWIQVLDENLTSVYRSWSDIKGDSLTNVREDLLVSLKTKKPAYSVSVGKFDLSIKAIVPIIRETKVVGILEVISHFNSISKQLYKDHIESVVILDKSYTKQLLYPFTKLFIGEYYVANFDAPIELMNYLSKYGVKTHITDEYIYKNGYLSTSHKLKSLDDKIIGYYMMFKKVDNISSTDLEYFVFKKFMIGAFIFFIVIAMVLIVNYYYIRKQKIYYKSIVNSSTNIVLLYHKNIMTDVNSTFFNYFYKYKALAEFKSEHVCICDMFVEKDKYLQKEMNGVNWIKYLLKHESHKAELFYEGNKYYFLISAFLIKGTKNDYSIVLTDISNEEKYKHNLELLSVTDALTGIYNRRYFDKAISKELSNSNRYWHALSMVMLDIDHFKKINDEHGHQIGDDILIEYTKLISSLIREGDVFCRIGGEEFMIILPHTKKSDAQLIAQKIRKRIELHKKILPITMSLGVVQYSGEENVDEIYVRVDNALYEAKETGRNRVVIA